MARLACHRSIRAGRRLEAREMSALLREMEATPNAATCSHGRPTFLKLTKAELEKMFGRRVTQKATRLRPASFEHFVNTMLEKVPDKVWSQLA